MNKTLTIFMIILLSIVAIVLTVITVILSTGNFDTNFSFFNFMNGQSNKIVDTKEFDNVRDINIDSDVADIYIRYSEDDKYRVELYSDNVDSYSIDNSNNLTIKMNEKNNWLLFRRQARIVLYIPNNYSNNIEINDTTGDINVYAFENASFKVNVTTGDINIDKANVLDITTKTGDVVNSKSNIILLHCTTGDITLGEVNQSLDITTTTGDITINKINLTESSNIKTTTGDVVVREKNDNVYVEVETNTGNINIHNNDRFAELVLKIKATTGDIKVG